MKTLRSVVEDVVALVILTLLYGAFVALVLLVGGDSPVEWVVIAAFGFLWLCAMVAALAKGPMNLLLEWVDSLGRRY